MDFIVSFTFYAENSENDGARFQDFLLAMEATIRDHPLWASASEEEIDCAVEGLEKYVMTKLFSRTFGSSPEDARIDREISEKVLLLQNFLRPEHLDIPAVFNNEASWLNDLFPPQLAEKELLKINAFRAPREKLVCILNCCRVINNLLLNASISEDRANPPKLHSNLKFIQLYRRQAKLVSEAAYYFTNLVSVKTFIIDLDAKSLSIGEAEFQESMQAARLARKRTGIELSHASDEIAASAFPPIRMPNDVKLADSLLTMDEMAALGGLTDAKPSTSGSNYPYMEVEPGELTVRDVEKLLTLYKDVVKKYTNLCEAVKRSSLSPSKKLRDVCDVECVEAVSTYEASRLRRYLIYMAIS
ncbi:hypothetical protein RJ639_030861 [Escallonia herrerae]|uniref:VPS9 domain-containing protein n=1 Tax=Escallonia herrerae TaxID=1293975 RepID=A0AA89BIV3_9ASTE|nr:hypothetical protein RJ639_030861 [Escallonia herrerae]